MILLLISLDDLWFLWSLTQDPGASRKQIFYLVSQCGDPKLRLHNSFILWSADQIILLDNSFVISLAIFLGLFSSFLVVLILPWWSPHRYSLGSIVTIQWSLCRGHPISPLSLLRRREALHAGTHFRKGGRGEVSNGGSHETRHNTFRFPFPSPPPHPSVNHKNPHKKCFYSVRQGKVKQP